ncbi:hypothetical protein EDD85DRAFT_784407 [Armillaria nabsnona]|nr:hypothetical protein EDD85DRAFT_784407 [Armillaria nabsnona]
MPQDSDIHTAVRGFSSQLRARVLQARMTKPTTDDAYASCRTRGRSSVCVAYNISCSNCSTLSPVAMKERIEFSEYTNSFTDTYIHPPKRAYPASENEDLRRENERLRERFCLEVEPKVHCKRSFTTASGGSTTIETVSTSGIHDKSLGTDRKSDLQIYEIELGTVI